MTDVQTQAPDVIQAEPDPPPVWKALVTPIASIAGIIVVLILILLAVGVDPVQAGNSMIESTFGSERSFGETLVRATPMLIIAATLIPSLRAGLYNIGAPGQIAAGGLVATLISLNTPSLPSWLVLVLCFLASATAGMIVAAIPGALKAYFGVNEIISTLAMNFIMLSILGWLLNGPMKGDYANLPQSDTIPPNAELPILIPDTRAHVGLLIALAFVPLLWVLDKSRTGYRLRVFSANPQLVRQTRASRKTYLIGLMALGGVGAGLAGWMQVAAIDNRLYPTISDPVGYAGLFVALLGALHPLGIVLAAFIFGALLHGGEALQIGANVSPEIVQVVLGLILLAYAARRSASATTSTRARTTRRMPWTSSKR